MRGPGYVFLFSVPLSGLLERVPMPAIAFDRLRQQVPLAEVLHLVGCTPSWRCGAQVRGPCPLHGAGPRSRSFSAQLERGLWHCFGCGRGGNALDLWVLHTRLPLHAAALDLCQRLGLPVPWLEVRGDSPQRCRPP